jgi:hypothetical protein
MSALSDLKNLKPLVLSPETRLALERLLRESIIKQYGEQWVALQEMEDPKDVAEALSRIQNLQGLSPRDKVWPLQPWEPEPPQEPGWDSGNTLNFAAAKQVYDEYVAMGKIIRRQTTKSDLAAETDSKGH